MLIRALIYLEKKKITHHAINLKNIACILDNERRLQRLVYINFIYANIHSEPINQTKDLKALGVVILRLFYGYHAKMKSDKEVFEEFNKWRGGVSEQDY